MSILQITDPCTPQTTVGVGLALPVFHILRGRAQAPSPTVGEIETYHSAAADIIRHKIMHHVPWRLIASAAVTLCFSAVHCGACTY